MPILVESDVEPGSDCDSLPAQDSFSEAAGGYCVVRDLWSDHPMQQVDKLAPLPKDLGKPLEKVIIVPQRDSTNSSEEDKYGRTPDGRSKSKRKPVDYKCHLGDKQTPPGVRRLAPKL